MDAYLNEISKLQIEFLSADERFWEDQIKKNKRWRLVFPIIFGLIAVATLIAGVMVGSIITSILFTIIYVASGVAFWVIDTKQLKFCTEQLWGIRYAKAEEFMNG